MAVEEQMEMAFSDEERVDPVSGNEVPTGSLPEEVRDNIDARLSEGEYVVPADVVRFFGVKFFEDLRTQAKLGFSDMEANGRIGGEPMSPEGMEMGADELPFDVSELEVQEFDEGGLTRPIMDNTEPQSAGIEIKEYVGPDGQTLFVQFINGVPLTYVPRGYTLKSTASEEVAEEVAQPQSDDRDEPIEVGKRERADLSSIPADPEEADAWYKSVSDEIKGAKSFAGASAPIIGLAQLADRKNINTKLTELLESDDVKKDKEKANKITSLLKQLEGEEEADFLGRISSAAEDIRSGIGTAADNFKKRESAFYDPLEEMGEDKLDFGKRSEEGEIIKQSVEERQKDKDQSLSNALVSGGRDAWHKQASDNYRKDMEAAGYTATPTGFVKEDKPEEDEPTP